MEFLEQYSDYVTFYSKKNGGVSSARNYGLKKANGQYITFLDSDECSTLLYPRRDGEDGEIIV